MSSPRMICSVKFLQPMTIRGWERQAGNTAHAAQRKSNEAARTIIQGRGHALDKDLRFTRLFIRVSLGICVVPAGLDQVSSLPRTYVLGYLCSAPAGLILTRSDQAAGCGVKRFSSQPRIESASNAMRAAGIAPARITEL